MATSVMFVIGVVVLSLVHISMATPIEEPLCPAYGPAPGMSIAESGQSFVKGEVAVATIAVGGQVYTLTVRPSITSTTDLSFKVYIDYLIEGKADTYVSSALTFYSESLKQIQIQPIQPFISEIEGLTLTRIYVTCSSTGQFGYESVPIVEFSAP